MIKLIACDLDGTVLDDSKKIDSGLREIVDKLREKGIAFTFVSGRNAELTKEVISHFDIDLPYVCNNGANIYRRGELLLADCIIGEYADRAARLLYENDIAFRAYTLSDIFCNGMTDFFRIRMNGFSTAFLKYTTDIDLRNYDNVKITADFIDHEDRFEELSGIIRSFPDTDFTKAEPHVYCVNSVTANKGDGLKRVCDMIGIDMAEEVMAFGDNENDLPMLERVKVSVAVANCEQIVRDSVDYLCGDNNHNGVSVFLKEYFKL